MNLIVVARTKNEENNVARFIEYYKRIADTIIIVDGGSTDKTVELAELFGAKVFKFVDVVERNDINRNPHGKHLNFCIRLAESYNADWIIHDDLDCIPNYELQKNGRRLLEESERDFVYMTRVYMYKDRGYASAMSNANGEWQQSLWAWRVKGFRFSEDDPFAHTFTEPYRTDIWKVKPPYALLHYPWPNDAVIDYKKDFYTKIYDREIKHPLEYSGSIKQLEWWMNYDEKTNKET